MEENLDVLGHESHADDGIAAVMIFWKTTTSEKRAMQVEGREVDNSLGSWASRPHRYHIGKIGK